MRFVVYACLLALLALLCTGCDKSISENDIKFASLSEVKQFVDSNAKGQKNALIIDPRPASSYAVSRIPGAVTLSLPSIDVEGDQDPALAAYPELIVYGDNPASPPARAMTKKLLAAGYKETRMFAGGLDEWKAAYPPETGTPTNQLSPRRRKR